MIFILERFMGRITKFKINADKSFEDVIKSSGMIDSSCNIFFYKVLGYSGWIKNAGTISFLNFKIQGTAAFTTQSDEQSILDAYTAVFLPPSPFTYPFISNKFQKFVKVQQQLLNILIGKAGLINDLPFVGPPLAQVFRSFEGVVDVCALFLNIFLG